MANDRTQQARTVLVQGKIIELVENGVDFSVWRSDSTLSKEPNNQVHFVFLGRLADWKGVDLQLKAFVPVPTKIDAVLAIISDREMRGELEAQTAHLGLSNKGIFSGWQSEDRCAIKLQQADVLVLPSWREPSGAVIVEAMAVALPVIATNWGGLADSSGFHLRYFSRTLFQRRVCQRAN